MTISNFDSQKFMQDYNKWRSISFPAETAEADEVYDLRYDVFELDANIAGIFITFADSDFRDINHNLNDKKLSDLLRRAKELKKSVEKHDSECVDRYIEYMELMLSMYNNYKKLSSQSE